MKEINLTITVISKSQFKHVLEVLNRLTYVKNIKPNYDTNKVVFSLDDEKNEMALQSELEKENLGEVLIRKKGFAKKKIFAFFEKREK